MAINIRSTLKNLGGLGVSSRGVNGNSWNITSASAIFNSEPLTYQFRLFQVEEDEDAELDRAQRLLEDNYEDAIYSSGSGSGSGITLNGQYRIHGNVVSDDSRVERTIGGIRIGQHLDGPIIDPMAGTFIFDYDEGLKFYNGHEWAVIAEGLQRDLFNGTIGFI